MADTDKRLNEKGFVIYDALLRHYIYLKRKFATKEQIDDLFPSTPDPEPQPVEPDPGGGGNNDNPSGGGNDNPGGGGNEEPENNIIHYVITNLQNNEPWMIIKEYSNDTLVQTYSISSTTNINNHFIVYSKGAYVPGEYVWYIKALTNLTFNNTRYNANASIDNYYAYKAENTIVIL